jgi:hypothetical protein
MTQQQQHDAPVSITSARTGRSADIKHRQVRYLISMGIRTLCFVLAIVLPSPVRWIMVGAAFILPYIAVVIANTSDGRDAPGPSRFDAMERPGITSGPDGAVPPGGHGDLDARDTTQR